MRELSGEWPNPLDACPGYEWPVGLPLTLQLGDWISPHLSAYSVRRDGQDLQACGFDATSYSSKDSVAERNGKLGLRAQGAVVVIPREPLTNGEYSVSVTVDGQQYVWSFRVSS